jgi:hypothetical protein
MLAGLLASQESNLNHEGTKVTKDSRRCWHAMMALAFLHGGWPFE